MGNFEEVKKILIDMNESQKEIGGIVSKGYINRKAKEICRLFEPKPDESRELEMAKMAWRDFLHAHADECDVDAVVDLIVATTASIRDGECQEWVERIFKEIENHFGVDYSPKDWWQALKKQEQVSNG